MNIKQRLKAVETAINLPAPKNRILILVIDDGKDDDNDSVDDAIIGYKHDKTGIVYGVDDDLSHIKGFHFLTAVYNDDDLNDDDD
ncbi:hypothetical protein LBMAG43_17370 [Methylococcaceae bacterium]|nr:hypothetical protein LBMAG43_17370 [Methylococcaceae bacterium]